MKLGVLGGTFDPIHLGHLRVAEEIGEGLELQIVYLIPAAIPPHKGQRPVTPFQHRMEMTRLAARESPRLEALDLEGHRQGLSYSIETLRELHRHFEIDLELFFFLGMDAFLEITTWKEYRKLFDYAHFLVISRPGFPSDKLELFVHSLGVGFQKKGEEGVFTVPSGKLLIHKEATLMDISSTNIRKRIAEGKSTRFLVPESVREYVMEKRLYRGNGHTQ